MVEIAKMMTDKVVGYIHNVSPLKHSKKTKIFRFTSADPKCYRPWGMLCTTKTQPVQNLFQTNIACKIEGLHTQRQRPMTYSIDEL